MTEVIDARVIDESSADLVAYSSPSAPVRSGSALIALAGTVEEIAAGQQAYQDLCRKLLDATDYQEIGDKSFKKRSAWNKLSIAFGVSVEELRTIHERNAQGRIVRTECHVRAISPNGRFADGIGACDVWEDCCPGEGICTKLLVWEDSGRPTGHVHCKPDCSGLIHNPKSGHDVPATAFTRASNRAKADLFGMGEVSAEEAGRERSDGTQGASSGASNGGASGKPISDKQVPFLNTLLSETGMDLFDLKDVIGAEVVTVPNLTGAQAKVAIDHLIAIRDGKLPRAPQPEHRKTTASAPTTSAVAVDVAPIGRAFRELNIEDHEARRSAVATALGREVPAAWGGSLSEDDVQKVLAYLSNRE